MRMIALLLLLTLLVGCGGPKEEVTTEPEVEVIPKEELMQKWEKQYAKGQHAYDKREYNKAIKVLTKSLVTLEKAEEKGEPLARTLHRLGTSYMLVNEFDQALPLLERALYVKETQLGKQHPELIKTLNNLGKLYQAEGKYRQAEPFYLRALAISEKGKDKHDPELILPLLNLGVLYYKETNYKKAESQFKRALNISERHNNTRILIIMGNLQAVYRKTGRLKEADLLQSRIDQLSNKDKDKKNTKDKKDSEAKPNKAS